MTYVLAVLPAVLIGFWLGRKHRPPLPLSATRVQFIKQLPGSRHVELTELSYDGADYWQRRQLRP